MKYQIKSFVVLFAVLCIQTNLFSQGNRIFGGQPINISDAPWMVSIQQSDPLTYLGCGIIINENWVLTAAHVVDGRNYVRVLGGATEWANITEGQRLYGQVINHPELNLALAKNDLALIHLVTPFCYNTNVQPIEIVSSNLVIPPGVLATIMGWGNSGNGTPSDVLLSTNLPIISNVLSQTLINSSNNICPPPPTWTLDKTVSTYEIGKACGNGDSGGPLIIYQNGKPIVVGIASWKGGCPEPEFPTVYVDVREYIDFINSNITIQNVVLSTSQIFAQNVIEGDLIIKAPADVSIFSEVQFSQDSRLIVEMGAKLTLGLGGVLTSKIWYCEPQVKRKWKGVQLIGNPFIGQGYSNGNSQINMYNNAVIENAEIGINTSNPVLGGFFGYLNFSGGLVDVQTSFIRDCDIGINFGPRGGIWQLWETGPLITVYDQSKIRYTDIDNCQIGIKFESNHGVKINNTDFNTGAGEVGIEANTSKIIVSNCNFIGGLDGINMYSTWPTIEGSSFNDNNFFTFNNGIFWDAIGNLTAFEVNKSFFANRNNGIYGNGISFYTINNNDFDSNEIGLGLEDTGNKDFNVVNDNLFNYNQYGTTIEGVNNTEFNNNCFEEITLVNLELNNKTSIFDPQGESDYAAGNCFTKSAIPIATGNQTEYFTYFVLEANVNSASCKYPDYNNNLSGFFGVNNASNEDALDCGTSVLNTIIPKYRNCIIPENLEDKMAMETALINEINQIKNNPNIPLQVQKWLIAKYQRCLKKLKGFILQQITITGSIENVLIYLDSQIEFEFKIVVYSIYAESGQYENARNLLISLDRSVEKEEDFIEAQLIYLDYLERNKIQIDNTRDKQILEEIILKQNEYSGFARAIYKEIYGIRITPNLNHIFSAAPKLTNVEDTENIDNKNIKLFPNPVLDNVINLNINYNSNNKYILKIRNLLGVNVSISSIEDNVTKINLDKLDSGFYVVDIIMNNKLYYSSKFIKI